MFLIDDGKLMFGAAINFNDICWVYPLKIKEIIGMGQDTYNEYLSFLALDIREIQKELKKQGVSEENMPIILDEAFAYYDTERLTNILTYLNKTYTNKQIIIFTCSKREQEILEKNNIKYTITNLQ